MADPQYQYQTQTGLVVPDTSVTLAAVQQEWKNAFGSDLIVTADTPQGVMITAEALARNNVIRNNAALANQINPNTSGGVFLDAILALTGVQRTPSSPTTVAAVAVTGVAGTTIPIGVQAKTDAGDLFVTTEQVTLDVSGNATVNFASVENGPVPCDAHALTNVVTAILGWETVDNANAGVPGSSTQSDQQARAFRLNTLAFQGVSLAEAITSALYATNGVKSLFFQENVTGATVTLNGITMVSHSVYACIDGGLDEDVAAALLENKSSGAAWNGGTEVSVIEPASGQAYTVKFDRPSTIGILVTATVKNITAAQAIAAILAYAAGEINGEAGFVVGADVSPFELAGAINEQYPQAYVSDCQISKLSPVSYGYTPIGIGVDEIAYTQLSYITITLG